MRNQSANCASFTAQSQMKPLEWTPQILAPLVLPHWVWLSRSKSGILSSWRSITNSIEPIGNMHDRDGNLSPSQYQRNSTNCESRDRGW